jgi:O-antigen/teichoic acid export membrane protein
MRVILSSTFYLLLLLSAGLGILFLIAFPFGPWGSLYNAGGSQTAAVAGPATLVFVFVTLVGMPFTLADGVRSGFQEGFANNLWQAAGSVVALVALWIEVGIHVGLPALVLALAGGAALGSSLNAVALVRRRGWLLPRLSLLDWEAGRAAVRRGLMFLAIGVSWVIAIQSDALVIARILGPAAVSSYAIPLRISAVVVVLCNLFIAPLWPAYKDALARGDVGWAIRTLRRSLLGGLLLSLLLASIFYLGCTWLMRVLFGSDIPPPSKSLLLALSLYAVIAVLVNALQVFLYSGNHLRFLLSCVLGMALFNLALSIGLTRSIGVSGPVWATVIAVSLIQLVPYTLRVRVWVRESVGLDGA